MDTRHLVIAGSANAANDAIAALSNKDWKPSGDIQNALADMPETVLGLAIFNSVETAPSLLSNLPGTAQLQINSGIAISNTRAAELASSGAGSLQPGVNGPYGRNAPMPRNAKADEFAGGRNDRRGRRFDEMNAPAFGMQSATPGASANAMKPIQFRLLPDQLPKPEEIRPLLFPTTLYMLSDGQGLVVNQRRAFPEQLDLESNATALGIIMPMIQAARARTKTSTPSTTAGGANNPGGQPPAAPGGIQGGRRRRDL
jgi:hypothetical protein